MRCIFGKELTCKDLTVIHAKIIDFKAPFPERDFSREENSQWLHLEMRKIWCFHTDSPLLTCLETCSGSWQYGVCGNTKFESCGNADHTTIVLHNTAQVGMPLLEESVDGNAFSSLVSTNFFGTRALSPRYCKPICMHFKLNEIERQIEKVLAMGEWRSGAIVSYV